MRNARGTFVIQLDDPTSLTADTLGGRIEHVLSGATVEFSTVGALLEFIRSTCARNLTGTAITDQPEI